VELLRQKSSPLMNYDVMIAMTRNQMGTDWVAIGKGFSLSDLI
jgi:hypothetical protein